MEADKKVYNFQKTEKRIMLLIVVIAFIGGAFALMRSFAPKQLGPHLAPPEPVVVHSNSDYVPEAVSPPTPSGNIR